MPHTGQSHLLFCLWFLEGHHCHIFLHISFLPFYSKKKKIKAEISVPTSARYYAISSALNFIIFGCVCKCVGAHLYVCEDQQSTSDITP